MQSSTPSFITHFLYPHVLWFGLTYSDESKRYRTCPTITLDKPLEPVYNYVQICHGVDKCVGMNNMKKLFQIISNH